MLIHLINTVPLHSTCKRSALATPVALTTTADEPLLTARAAAHSTTFTLLDSAYHYTLFRTPARYFHKRYLSAIT